MQPSWFHDNLIFLIYFIGYAKDRPKEEPETLNGFCSFHIYPLNFPAQIVSLDDKCVTEKLRVCFNLQYDMLDREELSDIRESKKQEGR